MAAAMQTTNEGPSSHFQVQADEPVPFQGVTSPRSTWLPKIGLGGAGLILVGISTWALLQLSSPSVSMSGSADHSRHVPKLSFTFGAPALRSEGLHIPRARVPPRITPSVPRMQVGPGVGMADAPLMVASPWDMKVIDPSGKLKKRVQGKSRRDWSFNNLEKDRVQVAVTSEGRPIKADIQCWIGPNWTPFTVKAYTEDGRLRPINTLIGTRNKPATIDITNEGEMEFPFDAAANYAEGPMSTLALDIPASMPGAERVDGGAVRSNVLETSTERLDVVLNTEGMQLNARIELLAGPNNPKQSFEVFTNNGVLNSLCVSFATPQAGNTIRIVNLAPLEFPLYYYTVEI